jgi:hypothetical protein
MVLNALFVVVRKTVERAPGNVNRKYLFVFGLERSHGFTGVGNPVASTRLQVVVVLVASVPLARIDSVDCPQFVIDPAS